MKIAISAFASDNGKSGIGRYMISLLEEIVRLDRDHRYTLFRTESDKPLFQRLGDRVNHRVVSDFWGKPIQNIFWNQAFFPSRLKKIEADAALILAGNRRLPVTSQTPTVAVVHDLSPFHVAQKYDPLRQFYVKKVLPWMIGRMNRVITVSQSTAHDVIKYAQFPEDRIHVVHNGIDHNHFYPKGREESQKRLSERFRIHDPFILYVGRLEHPGKNHIRLIRAFMDLKRRLSIPHKLVLVGSKWNGSEAIFDFVDQNDCQTDVLFTDFVSYEDLPYFYSGCDVMPLPSLYEGFGIPAIEAMACGAAVCGSNLSSIPEVIGDAGPLFDPINVDEISDAIQRLLTDESLRRTCIQKGFEQAKKFSWTASARQTLDVIEKIK